MLIVQNHFKSKDFQRSPPYNSYISHGVFARKVSLYSQWGPPFLVFAQHVPRPRTSPYYSTYLPGEKDLHRTGWGKAHFEQGGAKPLQITLFGGSGEQT